MSDFAVRFGYKMPLMDLREDEMPTELMSGLWDMISAHFLERISGPYGAYATEFKTLCNHLWFSFYKRPTDEQPDDPFSAAKIIRSSFFASNFVGVYELIEFLARLPDTRFDRGGRKFARDCNLVLERERSAFRFADVTLVQISSREDLTELEAAITQEGSVAVREHIRRAAELYSQQPEPDYRNSIKESISAVEGAVSYVVGRKTNGIAKPLKAIADKYGMHSAAREGFEKLYAYTSDAGGIRHRLLEMSTLKQEDARYMLISCSAFANYLLALHARYGAAQEEALE